jgi:hypothetical protein
VFRNEQHDPQVEPRVYLCHVTQASTRSTQWQGDWRVLAGRPEKVPSGDLKFGHDSEKMAVDTRSEFLDMTRSRTFFWAHGLRTYIAGRCGFSSLMSISQPEYRHECPVGHRNGNSGGPRFTETYQLLQAIDAHGTGVRTVLSPRALQLPGRSRQNLHLRSIIRARLGPTARRRCLQLDGSVRQSLSAERSDGFMVTTFTRRLPNS